MAELAICKLQDFIMAEWGPGRTCIGMALFFMATCARHLSHPPAPFGLKTGGSTACRWCLSLFPFVRGEPRSDATWWILLEALSHGLRQWRLPGDWVPSWLVNETIVGGTSSRSRVFLLSCSLIPCTYIPLPCSKGEWARERERKTERERDIYI
jgi:hypothetical protein